MNNEQESEFFESLNNPFFWFSGNIGPGIRAPIGPGTGELHPPGETRGNFTHFESSGSQHSRLFTIL